MNNGNERSYDSDESLGNADISPLGDRELLEELVRALVESPGMVRVEEQKLANNASHLVIRCAPHDRGKVIGKSGRTAEAIRTLFISIASLEGRKVFIEIDEPRDNGRVRRQFNTMA